MPDPPKPRHESPDERRERQRQTRLTARLVAWIAILCGVVFIVLYRRGL